MTLIAPIASVAAATIRATTPSTSINRTSKKQLTSEELETSLFEPKAAPAPLPASALAPAPVVPTITATKADSFTDAAGDGADLGQTIDYTVTVTNTAGTDATTVAFNDTIDPNTTFVGGSVIASAVAVNDIYPQTVIGNLNINSATIGYSVVSNDFLGINPTATISAFDATSVKGGTVNMTTSGAGIGQFTYNPRAGYEGTDTFTYTLSDQGGNPSAALNRTATVTLSVSGMVWFVNNTAGVCSSAASGCGRLTNPYNSLASFQNDNGDPDIPGSNVYNPAINDNIFIYESATAYNSAALIDSLTLLNGQKLFGQDSTSTLNTLTGLTPPSGSAAFPATNSGNGTIVKITTTAPAGNPGITLNSAGGAGTNTINGLTVGNTTGAGIFNNGANSFGTLTVADVSINEPSSSRTGQALSLTNGTVNGTFINVTSTSATTPNVALASLAGTVNLGTGTLSGSTSNAFSVSGNTNPTATISYGGTITSTTANAVSITGKSAGTVTFSGAITATGGTGISITSNTGATRTDFTGGITLNGASAAFTANSAGEVNVTGSNNTIGATTTPSVTAVNIVSTTIGGSGVTFKSVSVNGGSKAISLNGTGTGAFTISGTGTTDGTGGTIQNVSARGAEFITAQNITLKNMNFTNAPTADFPAGPTGLSLGNNTADNATIHLQTVTNATLDNLNLTTSAEQGINGHNVNGFTLSNSVLSGIGNGADEDGLHFYNMVGTCALTNNSISGSGDDNVNIQNNTVIAPPTTTGTITISGGSYNTGVLGSGLLFGIRGTHTTNINISGVTVNNNFSGGIVADAFDTATMDLDVTTSTITNNNDGVQASSSQSATVKFDIYANTSFAGQDFLNITVLKAAFSTVSGSINGKIRNNTSIVTANGRPTDSISVFNAGAGPLTLAITGNTFSYAGTQRAILIQGGQDGIGSMNTTVTGNAFDIQLDGVGNAVTGILAQSAVTGPGNTTSLCADIGGAGALANTFTHSLGGVIAGGDIRLRQRNDGTVRLPGYGGGATDFVAVASYMNGRNTVVSPTTATADSTGFAGGASCTQPVVQNIYQRKNQREDLAWTNQPWSPTKLSRIRMAANLSAPGEDIFTNLSKLASGEAKGEYVLDDSALASISALSITPAASVLSQTLSTENRAKLAHRVSPTTLAAAPQRQLAVVAPGPRSRTQNVAATIAKSSAAPPSDLILSHHAVRKPKSLPVDDAGAKRLNYAVTSSLAPPPPPTVTVTVPTLPVTKAVIIKFQVTVNTTGLGTATSVSNQGTVTADGGISIFTDDSPGTATPNEPTLTPLARKDLSITSVTDGVTTAVPGDTLSYTVSYKNLGHAATGVVLTETIPANTVSHADNTAAGWVCTPDGNAGSTCTNTIGALAFNATGSKVFKVTIINPVPAGVTTISNTASISDDGAYDTDINSANNTVAPDVDTLTASPAFGTFTKSDTVTTAAPGDTLTYTINYANTGNQGATGIVLTDTVPAGTTFVASGSSTWTGCADGAVAGTVCTIAVGSLAGGGGAGSATFKVTVNNPAAAGLASIVNNTSITDDGGNSPSAVTANTSDTDTLNAFPDLAISKTPDVLNSGPNQTIVYTLTYSNIGNQGATGVVLTETVPVNTTFLTAGSSAWTGCANGAPAGTVCTIAVGALAGGGGNTGSPKTFAVKVIASPSGAQVTNVATIADDGANGADSNPANNTTGNVNTPLDTPPTIGDYGDTSVFVTQGTTVVPTTPPSDDQPGFTVTASILPATFTGTVTVPNQTTGDVVITGAAPADTYTVTVKVTDSVGQFTTDTFQLTVNKSGTSTVLTSSQNPSYFNQNVTFKATVTSATTVTPVTGTVDFFDNSGATLICDDRPLNGAGEATCSISTLSIGNHNITSTYNGDATFALGTSTVLTGDPQVVSPALILTVNTLGDAVDANPPNGICDTDAAPGDQCTLREAIRETNGAPSADTILFSLLANSTITLDSALDAIDGDLTITGPGANTLTVQRSILGAPSRIFTVNSGKTVGISGLTLSGGSATIGGGILNDHGTLTLTNMAISGNSAGDGGGIYSDGRTSGSASLTIKGSTISGNTSTNTIGGGGGGVYADGTGGGSTVTLENSTVSGNFANNHAGGMYVFSSTTTLTSVTVTDNHSDNDTSGIGAAGGLAPNGGTLTLHSTIVAKNYRGAATTTPDDINGAVETASSYNLIGDGAGMTGITHNDANKNQVGTGTPIDPLLGSLMNNGGPTSTHALQPGSPAIDKGNSALATDQRGSPRLVDNGNVVNAGNGTDIGAYEAPDTTAPTVSITAVSPDPRNSSVSSITIVFSEVVQNFDITDMTLTRNGGADLLPLSPASLNSGSNPTFTLENLGTLTGTAGTYVLTLSVSDITDANGNALSSGATETWVVDTTAPTLLATGFEDNDADNIVLQNSVVNYTVTFSEDIDHTTVSAADFDNAGTSLITIGTITETSLTSGVFNVPVTPTTPGTLILRAPAGATITDQAGNAFVPPVQDNDTLTVIVDTFTTFEVNTLNDDAPDGACNSGPGNDCTLREAIIAANADAGPETITFLSGLTGTITLNALGVLPNLSDITITGPGANALTVARDNAASPFSIFVIPAGNTVNISGLTIANGLTPDGAANGGGGSGGGIANVGTLILSNSVVSGNKTGNAAGASGSGGPAGGIFNSGTLNVNSSTISGNQTGSTSAFGGLGGGIYSITGSLTITDSTISGNTSSNGTSSDGNGGGIYVDSGTVTIKNSTVSGNFATGDGGGIYNKGTLTTTNVTLSLNSSDSDNDTAGSGGGIFRNAGTVTIHNTIVAGNLNENGATDAPDDISGAVTAGSLNNLIGVDTGLTGITNNNNGNQIGTAGTPKSASLGPLANNGGPTQTHALLPGSLAINTGSNAQATAAGLTTFDQRGTPFSRTVFTTVDIGAFEVQAGTPDHLVFSVQPSTTSPGSTITPAVKVEIRDAGNTLVNSTANVTVAIGTNPGAGTLSGTLTIAAVAGVATFSNLSINNLGNGYTLTAASTGLTGATSNTFNIVGFPAVSGTKTASGTFAKNSTVTYTVVLTNSGGVAQPDNSGNEFADVLPASLTLVSATASSGTAVNAGTNTATWNGSIAANGGTVTITITATVKSTNAFGATISNQGNINFDADNNGSNETPGLTDDPGVAGTTNPTVFTVSGQPAISISDVSLAEGNSGTTNFNFNVTLDAASASTVTVNYATADGTATAPSDYTALSSTTLTFAPGDLSKPVTVFVNGDTSNESNETFFLNLSTPVNATIADNQGQGTVQNDDTPLIQFSSALFTINEGAVNTPEGFASIAITVNRTGDVSGAATVRYATHEPAGTIGIECDVNSSGNASQRCDYLMLSGTLRFAAGQASQDILIPIINDVYVEPTEQFTVDLTSPTGGSLGATSLTTAQITDNDTVAPTSSTNPYLNNSFFVRQHYVDFLEREPDTAGFNDWLNVLNTCNPNQGFLGAPASCDRSHISKGFIGATEFIDRGFLIFRLYEVGLNRLPDFAAEYNPDSAQLRGFGLTPAQIQTNLDNYLLELGARPEFVSRYASVSGNNTSEATQLIQLLETTAGVTLPASPAVVAGNMPPQFGRADLINMRATGALSVVQTVKTFVEQKVVYDKEYPRGFVIMQYFGYLHRNPDSAGAADWLDVLLNGRPSQGIAPGDYRHLIFGFIYSTEYRKRFGTP